MVDTFRLLAELVKSYGFCAKLITDHVYDTSQIKFKSMSDFLLREETTALAYLLDDLLINKQGAPTPQNTTDPQSGGFAQHVKTLVAALSSCNQVIKLI